MTGDARALVNSYIRAGLPVLPLHWPVDGMCSCKRPDCGIRPDGTIVGSPAKHPLNENGKDGASTDPEVVDGWFKRWPGCNWGIRPTDKLVVLDIDPRSGGGTAMVDLIDTHGPIGATLTAGTGGGGLHAWLSYSGPMRGKLARGIDVKGPAGYLVAPPSVHITGGVYRWLNGLPAIPAPAWVREMLNPPVVPLRRGEAPVAGSIAGLAKFVAALGEGGRNHGLYWAACRAVGDELDPMELLDAAAQCGLSEHEATITIRSAMRSAA